MEPTVSTHFLATISDNTWFVLGAYLFAFYPWIANADYISEKWRTVRRTRDLGRYHSLFSIAAMMYIAVYADSQRRAGDTKEFGTALAALLLNFYDLTRTAWGLAHLNAFMAWCKEAMECLRAMEGDDEDGASTSNSNERDGFSNDYDDELYLEKKLMVNNTVVDNELGKMDLSFRRVWVGVKRWELQPSTWLKTECAARWAATFLCGMANVWCSERYQSWSRAGEALNSFFSGDMDTALDFLRDVTCSVEESDISTIVSLRENDYAISGGAAYDSDALDYVFGGYKLYKVENDSLRSSYPGSTANRELAVAGLAGSVELARHLGVIRLSAMRRYFDRYRLPTNRMWRKAWCLLLEQVDCAPAHNSPLSSLFADLERIPFPYQLQLVALWDECTNWRVLQASAQADIASSIYYEDRENRNLFEMEPLPTNVFEYCRRLANTNFVPRRFLGVSMETVRTFLGEWVLSAPDVLNWEPSIPTDSFEFSASFRFSLGDEQRMIWECQRALQSELAKKSAGHENMSSSAELIMLFILSMQILRVEIGEEEDGEASVNNDTGVVSGGENSDATSSGAHSIVNLFVGVYRVYSPLAPQDISVVIRLDVETRRATLNLRYNGADARFKWEDWVNAAMGWMKGVYERGKKRGKNVGNIERTFRKADLRKPMLELNPLYCGANDLSMEGSPFARNSNDSLMETGRVRVWMGWPAFDVRICKFEIDQWLSACNIDVNNIELDRSGENRKVDSEINRAEETIRKVREVIPLYEADDRSEENGISETLH